VVRRLGLGPSSEAAGAVDPELALVLLGRLERYKMDVAVDAAKTYANFLVDELDGFPVEALNNEEDGARAKRVTEAAIRETWGDAILDGNRGDEEGEARQGDAKLAYEVNIDEDGELQVVYSEIDDEDDDEGQEEEGNAARLMDTDDDDRDGSEEEGGDGDDDDEEVSRVSSPVIRRRLREREIDQGVPVVYPTRSFSGHRNEDTVRFCVHRIFIPS
jgi:hypothetical protein